LCGRGKGDSDDDNEPEFASQQFPHQEAQEGQQADRGPWLHPVVPGPHHGPLPNDGDGWNRFDLLGVGGCGLLSVRALEEVQSRLALISLTILSADVFVHPS
jgi:hypothetical protein